MRGIVNSRLVQSGVRSVVWGYFLLLVVVPIIGVYVHGMSGGLEHMVKSVTSQMAWSAILLTLKLALIAALFQMLFGTVIAWVLVRYRFPGRRLLNSLVDLPFALPTAVGGLLILMLAGPQSALGGWAKQLGWEIVFQPPAIVIAMIFVTFPFVIRTVQPLLEEIDRSEEEASQTLGASRWTTWRSVVWPAIRPGVLSGTMLAFSRALAEFGAVVLVAGNLPGKTLVASVYIYGQIENHDSQAASAVSIVLLTLSLLILWGMQPLSERRGAL